MKNKLTTVLLLFLFCIALFGIREIYLYTQKTSQIVVFEESLLVQKDNVFFTWGNENDRNQNTIISQTTPFFKKAEVFDMDTMKPKTVLKLDDVKIEKITENVFLILFKNTRFLLVKKYFQEGEVDFSHIAKSLDSDFWILEKTIPNEFFSIPQEGIFFWGKNPAPPKVQKIAFQNRLSLISYQKTKGFRYTWNVKKNLWELYTF